MQVTMAPEKSQMLRCDYPGYWQLLMPGLFFAVMVLCLHVLNLDLRLADSIYRWEGGEWMRHHWLLDAVIHDDGRILAGVMLLVLVLALTGSFLSAQLRPYRDGLVYLFTVILISLALINIIKAVSGVPCPWSLTRYGGSEPFRDIWSGLGFTGGCFPAGHASGGYAWVALYFFARMYFPRWRFPGLAVGIGLGLVFGVGQQLRGAHFISHDIWTLTICWYVSLFGYLRFCRDRPSSRIS
jgi:membrane-associated PAP2 superfamily phosphatase